MLNNDFVPDFDFSPQYNIIEQIGSGAIGSCFLVNDNTDNTLKVIKIVKNLRLWQVLNKNPDLMLNLNHPNIVKTHNITFINGKPCIIQDYAEGTNLQQLSSQQPITLKLCLKILEDILSALAYLDSLGLSHKDIKPSNIIYDIKQNKATLVDLDYTVFNYYNHRKYLGTIQYSAPEQIINNRTSATADCYSLGLVIAYLIMGKIPFATNLKKQNDLVKQELLASIKINSNPILSAFYSFIEALLTYDFKERISINDALYTANQLKKSIVSSEEDVIFFTPDDRTIYEPTTYYPTISIIAKSLVSIAVTLPPTRHRRTDFSGDTIPPAYIPTVPPTASVDLPPKTDDSFRKKLVEEYDIIRTQAKISFRCWIASIILFFGMMITAMVLIITGNYLQGVLTALMDGFVVGVQKLFNIREDHYQDLVKQKLNHLQNLDYMDYAFAKTDAFSDPKERNQAAIDLLKQIKNDTKNQ